MSRISRFFHYEIPIKVELLSIQIKPAHIHTYIDLRFNVKSLNWMSKADITV